MDDYDARMNQVCDVALAILVAATEGLSKEKSISQDESVVFLAGIATQIVATQRGATFAREMSESAISAGIRARDVLMENRP